MAHCSMKNIVVAAGLVLSAVDYERISCICMGYTQYSVPHPRDSITLIRISLLVFPLQSWVRNFGEGMHKLSVSYCAMLCVR